MQLGDWFMCSDVQSNEYFVLFHVDGDSCYLAQVNQLDTIVYTHVKMLVSVPKLFNIDLSKINTIEFI